MFELKPAPGLAGQFEVLKHRIMASLNGLGGQPIVLAVTSCEAGEGKTTVASNFAASLAEDRAGRVLLIDADVRTKSLHTVFGQERAPGLTDVVVSLDARWPVFRAGENLDVLFTGTEISEPGRIFLTDKFRNLINGVKRKYSFTVIDCPPLIGKDGLVTAPAKADAVILVVQAERVRREIIQRAVAHLESAGARILGVVLNKRRHRIPRFIYKMI